jgi:hypothetical protein
VVERLYMLQQFVPVSQAVGLGQLMLHLLKRKRRLLFGELLGFLLEVLNRWVEW